MICYYPETSVHKGLLVKRIVAVGGDTVRIESGQLYVNGVAIDEPYITRPASRNFREYTVPEEHYFVMGDNRDHSDDSRNPQIGALPRDMIEGRVQAVFWPLTALRAIERYDNYAALENP